MSICDSSKVLECGFYYVHGKGNDWSRETQPSVGIDWSDRKRGFRSKTFTDSQTGIP